MSFVARRVVVAGGPTAYPVDDPPPGVQGVHPVTLPPLGPAPRTDATPDFYDILDDGTSDTEGFIVLYEAELYSDGNLIVKRDLFGPGDYPHTWAGWPIPGDPDKPPALAPNEADLAALAAIHAKR